jgi:hypothetical protein
VRSTSRNGVRRKGPRVSGFASGTARTVACVLAITSCAPGSDAPASDDAVEGVTLLTSPAGLGSAEPNLSSTGDGAVLSWLEPAGEGAWSLRLATLEDGDWGATRTVVTRDDLFVNWADFPAVILLSDGRLAAHWLQRGSQGGYDYGIRVVLSGDGGATWSEPWTPHEDGTPTEHGFVSLFEQGEGGLGVLWLDGRHYAPSEAGPATDVMTLRHRRLGADGTPGPEVEIDDRVCDCCQTSVAATADGWVAVYRDRAEDEVRDIFAARLIDGVWTGHSPVHRDGWVIDACPVNGPAVDARGSNVAAAWFTAAGDVSRVLVAFSDDGGASFREPQRVDGGDPVGRVDVIVEPTGSALVTWLERTAEGAEVRMRRVAPGAPPGDAWVIAATSAARGAGFPRTVALPDGDVLAAWTDVSGDESRVQVARVRPRSP